MPATHPRTKPTRPDLCGKATNYWDTRPSGVGGTGWENVSGRLMAVRWSASSCTGGQFTEGYQYDTGLLTIKRLYTPTLGSNSSRPTNPTAPKTSAARLAPDSQELHLDGPGGGRGEAEDEMMADD